LPVVQSPSAQPGLCLEEQRQFPATAQVGRRYYFHVRNDEIYSDENGTYFLSDQEAIAYAARVARELSEEGGWSDYTIALTEDDGDEIAHFPVLM
jgi:hypothetical protein